MVSLKNKQKGFTIVELLIVIVVIGILAALVVTTFSGIQQKARDKERQTDIGALHSQLEAYYAQNGSYPAIAEVNTGSWRTTNLKGLDSGALQDPKGTAQTLAGTASATQYGYVTNGGAACTTAAADCTSYTLTANKEEGTNQTFTKSSLN
ncbi:MAG: type II secretion system protein [Patescibacteria group bacterium]